LLDPSLRRDRLNGIERADGIANPVRLKVSAQPMPYRAGKTLIMSGGLAERNPPKIIKIILVDDAQRTEVTERWKWRHDMALGLQPSP
jgi:hypothetical protein